MVVFTAIVAIIGQKPIGALDYYRYRSGINLFSWLPFLPEPF